MKNLFVNFWFVAAISFLCSLSHADSKEDNLDHLLRISGLEHQIEQFPEAVRAGFLQSNDQDENPLSEELAALFLESAERTLLPSVILSEVRDSLRQSLDNEDIETMISWHETDLGHRIVMAEKNASRPEAYLEILEQSESLMQDSQRMAVAVRFDELLGITELMMEIQEVVSTAVFAAMMTALEPNQSFDLDEYRSQMQAMAPMMEAGMRQLVVLSLIYTYQDIDDASLADYETFLNLPVAKRFNDSYASALAPGLIKVVKHWATDLVLVLRDYDNDQSSSTKT